MNQIPEEAKAENQGQSENQQISLQRIAGIAPSLSEFYDLLAEEGDFLLAPKNSLKMAFMVAVSKGTKKVGANLSATAECFLIKLLAMPSFRLVTDPFQMLKIDCVNQKRAKKYAELRIEELLTFLGDHGKIVYVPDRDHVHHYDRHHLVCVSIVSLASDLQPKSYGVGKLIVKTFSNLLM